MTEHDTDPETLLADRGYDSDGIRDDVRARGGTPEIPTRKAAACSTLRDPITICSVPFIESICLSLCGRLGREDVRCR
ncbi:MAG: hypothetical protein JOZ42_01920 [Acetobacteraceae bacterium]|nr:hypothetical protein [Acetobacteraceae bacterium]